MTAKRTALVTGGVGLGRAIAQALHDAGHDVIVTYHASEANTRAWVEQEAAKGRRFAIYQVDVGDYASCQALMGRLERDGRQIDILINNAGITRDVRLRKMSFENWTEVMHSNLDSMFNMTQPLCGGMAVGASPLTQMWSTMSNQMAAACSAMRDASQPGGHHDG